MAVVARFGMKRTTMVEIARATGISRQTLYDRFGDKDGVMAALINNLTARSVEALEAAFIQASDLGQKLDAYFDIAVWPIFDLMESMPDARDFERGLGAASRQASQDSSALKRSILSDMLRPYLPDGPQDPIKVAAFLEQSSTAAKMAATSREELRQFLGTLKAALLALSRSDSP